MKIPNNQDAIAKRINDAGIDGVNAVGDDGSVCVQVDGDKARVQDVARILQSMNLDGGPIGDGVQQGDVFINGNDADIHDVLFNVVND